MKHMILVLITWLMHVPAAFAAGTYDSSLLHDTAIMVNGMPVSGEAFLFAMAGCRTACYDYFLQKYGAYDSADFWQHSFNGEVPAQWLEQQTILRWKEDICRLQAMQHYGVLNGFDFTRFKRQWKEENNRRQNGQLVYGNTWLDAFSFYSYLLSNAWLETQRSIVKQMPPDTAVMQQIYEREKLRAFQKTPTVSVRLYQQVAGGKELQVQDIVFEPAGRKADELQWGVVYTQSMQLYKPGARSAPFQNDAGQECTVECLVWQPNGYLPAGDVQENIKQLYAAGILEKQWQQLHAGCRIRVNKDLCGKLVAGGFRAVL